MENNNSISISDVATDVTWGTDYTITCNIKSGRPAYEIRLETPTLSRLGKQLVKIPAMITMNQELEINLSQVLRGGIQTTRAIATS